MLFGRSETKLLENIVKNPYKRLQFWGRVPQNHVKKIWDNLKILSWTYYLEIGEVKITLFSYYYEYYRNRKFEEFIWFCNLRDAAPKFETFVWTSSLFDLKASNLDRCSISMLSFMWCINLSIGSYLKLAPVPCAIPEWPWYGLKLCASDLRIKSHRPHTMQMSTNL